MRKKIIFFSNIIISLFFLIVITNCGIYVTVDAPNPPFSISMGQDTLKFSGDDAEAGYILWYKENDEDDYTVCVYKDNNQDIPTIPEYDELIKPQWAGWVQYDDFSNPPEIKFTIFISDLEHFEEGESFDILYNNEGTHFYFAVSSYYDSDVESEKVEFGIWPST